MVIISTARQLLGIQVLRTPDWMDVCGCMSPGRWQPTLEADSIIKGNRNYPAFRDRVGRREEYVIVTGVEVDKLGKT